MMTMRVEYIVAKFGIWAPETVFGHEVEPLADRCLMLQVNAGCGGDGSTHCDGYSMESYSCITI